MAVRSEQVSRNNGAVGGNRGARLFSFTFKNGMKRNKKRSGKLSKKMERKNTTVASAHFPFNTSTAANIKTINA